MSDATILSPEAQKRVEIVEKMMKVIGAKWKPAIMYCLVHQGPMRFGELKRAIPNITQRVLTLRLRELEHDGLIARRVIATLPAHVEYQLTDLGQELHPFYRDLCLWSEANAPRRQAALGEV